ncbi:hypothetical protein M3Y99_01970600 [Aphelenchoides fujianensis]|nr:hypothetical protein M3Y99_01970600 [Aphelenchoides fujianensis]
MFGRNRRTNAPRDEASPSTAPVARSRDAKGGMAFPAQFKAASGLKAAIILFTIIVVVLTDPTYVTAYISINYEIIIIYIVSSLTLLYCIVSIILYFFSYKSTPDDEEMRLTNSSLTEVVFASAGIMGWTLVCGIGGSVAQSTIIETGNRFGWLAAAGGINAALFLGVLGLFLSGLLRDKVFSPNRRYKYGSQL